MGAGSANTEDAGAALTDVVAAGAVDGAVEGRNDSVAATFSCSPYDDLVGPNANQARAAITPRTINEAVQVTKAETGLLAGLSARALLMADRRGESSAESPVDPSPTLAGL